MGLVGGTVRRGDEAEEEVALAFESFEGITSSCEFAATSVQINVCPVKCIPKG